MYFHINEHHKKVMKRQKNVQSNTQIAKIFCDLYMNIHYNARNHQIDMP